MSGFEDSSSNQEIILGYPSKGADIYSKWPKEDNFSECLLLFLLSTPEPFIKHNKKSRMNPEDNDVRCLVLYSSMVMAHQFSQPNLVDQNILSVMKIYNQSNRLLIIS